jgi:hypothetical protein
MFFCFVCLSRACYCIFAEYLNELIASSVLNSGIVIIEGRFPQIFD